MQMTVESQTPSTSARPSGKGKGKGSGGGGSAKEPSSPSAKNKFRETMWFKKGELDEAAAQAAAKAVAEGKVEDAADRSDSMPIEDRYADDGTLTRQDQERLSLRSGHTVMMDRAPMRGTPRDQVSELELVREMRDRKVLYAVIFVGLLLALGIVMWALS
jgi:hypothetical protein